MTASQVGTVLKRAFHEWSEDRALRLAAALACYTIISLAPLIVITMKMVSLLPNVDPAAVVEGQLQQLIGPAGARAIGDMIAQADQPGTGTLATIVSLLILLWSASYVFAEMQDSLNTVWEVKLRPDMGWMQTIKKRLLSIGMVFAIIFLLLVSMILTSILGTVVSNVVGANAEGAGFTAAAFSYVLEFVVTVSVVTLLFTMIYRYLPDVRIEWRYVWLGALVTAVLFKFGQYALAAYFRYGTTTSAYGAAGSLVAVLLWAYYSAAIFLFGAEFTQVYARMFGTRIVPDEDAVPVSDEERAQQGMPRQRDVEQAASDADVRAGQRGGLPRTEPFVPRRRVVTITQPALGKGTAYTVAGLGLAAGFAVGLIGLMKGRKFVHEGVEEVRLQQRLSRLEANIRRVTGLPPVYTSDDTRGDERNESSHAWETIKQGARNAVAELRTHIRNG